MDDLDKNIIFELEKNGRKTSTEIAQNLGVSKLTVTRHMQFLLNEQKALSIVGTPDPGLIGWQAHTILALKCDLTQMPEILDQLHANINVNHLVTLIGEYNLMVFAAETSWDALYALIREIKYVNGVLALDAFWVENTLKRFTYGNDGHGFGKLPEGAAPCQMDSIDKKIIGELIQDGRISLAKMADKINEPLSVVRRRTQYLIDNKVIKVRPIIDINYMLDVRVGVFVFLECAPEYIKQNADYLAGCDEITMVMTLLNNSDVFFLMQSTKPELLYKILNKRLADLHGVIRVKSYLRSEIKKRYYCKDLQSELQSFAMENRSAN